MQQLFPSILIGITYCQLSFAIAQFIFYYPPSLVYPPTSVTPLVVGMLSSVEQGYAMTGSVTLVQDSGYSIVVDSPSATDITAKQQMLNGLTKSGSTAGQVQMIVTTHGHPDHFGQGNFFPNARHFFGTYEYTGNTYLRTELYENDTATLTPNVQLWNTPGHTAQDISVIVRNTACCGTIAVVGDLIYSEEDVLDPRQWQGGAWNIEIGLANRFLIICIADYIVPGHGPMFKVSAEMRGYAQCNMSSVVKDLDSNRIDANGIEYVVDQRRTITTTIRTPKTATVMPIVFSPTSTTTDRPAPVAATLVAPRKKLLSSLKTNKLPSPIATVKDSNTTGMHASTGTALSSASSYSAIIRAALERARKGGKLELHEMLTKSIREVQLQQARKSKIMTIKDDGNQQLLTPTSPWQSSQASMAATI